MIQGRHHLDAFFIVRISKIFISCFKGDSFFHNWTAILSALEIYGGKVRKSRLIFWAKRTSYFGQLKQLPEAIVCPTRFLADRHFFRNVIPDPRVDSPRVTNPSATIPTCAGIVRLACLNHAASVRSEPESNSPIGDALIGAKGFVCPPQIASEKHLPSANVWADQNMKSV